MNEIINNINNVRVSTDVSDLLRPNIRADIPLEVEEVEELVEIETFDEVFICSFCLESEIDKQNIIEYNHCGLYHVHNDCLNKWTKKKLNFNKCFICRHDIMESDENKNCDNTNYERLDERIIHINEQHNNLQNERVDCKLSLFKILFGMQIFVVGMYLMHKIHNGNNNEWTIMTYEHDDNPESVNTMNTVLIH